MSVVPRIDEEQGQLRGVVRRFFEDKAPVSRVRELAEGEDGYDKAVWEQMAGQLGLQGLLVPEELGGSGATPVEAAIVLEEMGRALVGSPFLAGVLAVTALVEAGDEWTKHDLLPGIADGSAVVTVAGVAQAVVPDGLGGQAISAVDDAGQWRLTGEDAYVLDAGVADTLLVFARDAAGLSLHEVRSDAEGLAITTLATTDRTRRLARVQFDGAPSRLVGTAGTAEPVCRHVLDVASVGLAADDVGGALRLLELSAEYATVRRQFGRVIGSNQAIKQKLADMVSSVELARAAARRVADAAATDRAALSMEASMAKALCSDTYVQAGYDAIQVHGGIGFTWEHPAHLYFRRAISNAQLYGTPDQHRELAAQRLLA